MGFTLSLQKYKVVLLSWINETKSICINTEYCETLKGSYDVAKKNIILCFWCNAMCLWSSRLKKHIIFHILYIIIAHLCPAFLKLFLQSSSFWEARCALIGQLSGVLCLAKYLKRVTEIICPFPCCDAVSWPFYSLWSQCDETKTIKPAINEAFVAFSEDIMTHTVFSRVVPR